MKPEADVVLSGTLRLVRKIADGGMGSVWLAEHLLLGTEVAVKLMAGAGAESPATQARFLREARVTASLNSPHVVRVLDCRHEPFEEPYLVLELLRGENLEQRVLRQGPLPIPFVIEVVDQICEALTASHASGIVHRDLKPQNIFLVDGTETLVKLLDFGIAKPIALLDCLEIDRVAAGTPHYMSPEHLFDPGATDARSDLFSLAVVAYFALTGDMPFHGESLEQIYLAIDEGVFRRPSELRAGVSPGLDRWFQRALSPDPADRFADAGQMASALTEAVRAFAAPRALSPQVVRRRAISALPDRGDPSVEGWGGPRSGGTLGAVPLPMLVRRICLCSSLIVGAGANAQPAPPTPLPHLPHQVSRVFLDMKGDGIDLSGCPKSTGHCGPQAGADDRYLAIDIVEAAKAGYRIVSTEGVRGPVLMVGSGLRLTLPAGTLHESVDGWSTVALLDSNRDGLLGEGDSAPQRDAIGNDLADGAFSRIDRTVGRMADVSLASCDAPRDAGRLASADDR